MKLWIIILVSFSIMLCGNIGMVVEDGVEHTITVDGVGTNLRFVPDSLTINEGDSVHFLWSGEILPHNAIEENGLFDSGEPSRNVDYLYTFNYNQSGIYDFYCEPHEDVDMIGTITVLNIEEDVVEENIIDLENDEGGFLFIPIFFLIVIIFILYKSKVNPPERLVLI